MRQIVVKTMFCNSVLLALLLLGSFLFSTNPVLATDKVVLGELFNRDN